MNKLVEYRKLPSLSLWQFPVLILCLLSFTACNSKKAPDVSHIPMTVHIERFDKALAALDTAAVAEGLQKLHTSYPVFLPAYTEHIMNFGPYTDTSRLIQLQMHMLVTNQDFRVLQDSVNTRFPDLDAQEKELAQGFRYIKYYFPAFRPPAQIVAFSSVISNYGAVTIDSVLGIGLDMYLGQDFPIYPMLPDYPAYMIRKFAPEYLVTNAVQVLARQMYPESKASDKLIIQLIDAGKQQYFLQQVLPETPDTIRLGYTKTQMDWCFDNELFIWQYFVQNNLLYKADWQSNMHFMNDGPSTQGMPAGSPGRIGHFVGWQIVKRYMELHQEVTLQQLMDTKDAMKIFNEAKYRPK